MRPAVCVLVLWANGLMAFGGGGGDTYFRKYALIKVYESCLGADVVAQVRREMKAACDRCAGAVTASSSESAGAVTSPSSGSAGAVTASSSGSAGAAADGGRRPTATFDASRLQQAILGFKHTNPLLNPALTQYPTGYYPASQHSPGYYPAPPLLPFSSQHSQAVYYPTGYPVYPGIYPSPYYSAHRTSRGLALGDHLDSLNIGGRVGNMTCVMRELGYLDADLQPDYPHILSRINRLAVGAELRRDMVAGVSFCRRFSECVPDVDRDTAPLSRDLVKPLLFFRCYKHKKLEACILQDLRRKFQEEEGEGDYSTRLRSLPGHVTTGDMDDLLLATAALDMDSLWS